MLVDNVFKLINKFSKEEDQISAAFGFILKNNKKILQKFLKKIKINLKPRDLKRVDIETQVSYNSWESLIDLQLSIYNKFLVFVESKLYKNEEKIFDQLGKYKKVVKNQGAEYDNKIRLVYVNKHPIKEEVIQKLRERLKLSKEQFFFFLWEDLITMTKKGSKKETIKLFREYVGDTMYTKKVIKEQKIKEVKEVLIISTDKDFWRHVCKEKVACQKNDTPNAQYVAFYRNAPVSAITHIAKVRETQNNVLPRVTFKNYPNIFKKGEKRRWIDKPHKVYRLENLSKLRVPIKKSKKDKGGIRHKWFKTFGQILEAHTLSGLKEK